MSLASEVDALAGRVAEEFVAVRTELDGKLDDTQFLNGLTGVWIGTQAQYDAIGSKVSTVLYAIGT